LTNLRTNFARMKGKWIGEITKLEDFSFSEAFVWDGKEFKSKLGESDTFFVRNKVVRAKSSPFFKIVVHNLSYKIHLPGNFQSWLLTIDLEGVGFSLLEGKSKFRNWLFRNGIWRPKNRSFPAYKVSGKIPYWAALITVLEINSWLTG